MASLGLADSAVGAGAFASAAVDALVGVDRISGVTGSNSAHRANIGARAASDTKVGVDESRHNLISLNCCCFPKCEDRHYI